MPLNPLPPPSTSITPAASQAQAPQRSRSSSLPPPDFSNEPPVDLPLPSAKHRLTGKAAAQAEEGEEQAEQQAYIWRCKTCNNSITYTPTSQHTPPPACDHLPTDPEQTPTKPSASTSTTAAAKPQPTPTRKRPELTPTIRSAGSVTPRRREKKLISSQFQTQSRHLGSEQGTPRGKQGRAVGLLASSSAPSSPTPNPSTPRKPHHLSSSATTTPSSSYSRSSTNRKSDYSIPVGRAGTGGPGGGFSSPSFKFRSVVKKKEKEKQKESQAEGSSPGRNSVRDSTPTPNHSGTPTPTPKPKALPTNLREPSSPTPRLTPTPFPTLNPDLNLTPLAPLPAYASVEGQSFEVTGLAEQLQPIEDAKHKGEEAAKEAEESEQKEEPQQAAGNIEVVETQGRGELSGGDLLESGKEQEQEERNKEGVDGEGDDVPEEAVEVNVGQVKPIESIAVDVDPPAEAIDIGIPTQEAGEASLPELEEQNTGGGEEAQPIEVDQDTSQVDQAGGQPIVDRVVPVGREEGVVPQQVESEGVEVIEVDTPVVLASAEEHQEEAQAGRELVGEKRKGDIGLGEVVKEEPSEIKEIQPVSTVGASEVERVASSQATPSSAQPIPPVEASPIPPTTVITQVLVETTADTNDKMDIDEPINNGGPAGHDHDIDMSPPASPPNIKRSKSDPSHPALDLSYLPQDFIDNPNPDDPDDEILYTLPVYLSAPPHTNVLQFPNPDHVRKPALPKYVHTPTSSLHIFQYPLETSSIRPPTTSYEPITARMKEDPSVSRFEVEIPVDMGEDVWDEERAEEMGWGGGSGGGKPGGGGKKKGWGEKMRLRSEDVPYITQYHSGVVQDGALYLHPIYRTYQFRPSLTYLDEVDKVKRKEAEARRRRNDGEAGSDDEDDEDYEDDAAKKKKGKEKKGGGGGEDEELKAVTMQLSTMTKHETPSARRPTKMGTGGTIGLTSQIRKKMMEQLKLEMEDEWKPWEWVDDKDRVDEFMERLVLDEEKRGVLKCTTKGLDMISKLNIGEGARLPN